MGATQLGGSWSQAWAMMEMSQRPMPPWVIRLTQAIQRIGQSERLRVAIVGVGHEIYGDDAVGVVIARALLQQQRSDSCGLLIIDAGAAPESYIGALRRFGPSLVLVLDAADLSAVPGTIMWVPWQEADGTTICPHTLPLAMFAGYLERTIACEVALLGIQPDCCDSGAGLTPAVRKSVESVVCLLGQALASPTSLAAPDCADR
jgi:hydrogenase 3 maturation protease